MRRRSKIRRRPAPVATKPAAAGHKIDPLEYLARMNDERLPAKQRAAIARKILPYFHKKPKPIRPEELNDTFVENHPKAEDPGSASDERERLRKMLFGRFD